MSIIFIPFIILKQNIQWKNCKLQDSLIHQNLLWPFLKIWNDLVENMKRTKKPEGIRRVSGLPEKSYATVVRFIAGDNESPMFSAKKEISRKYETGARR